MLTTHNTGEEKKKKIKILKTGKISKYFKPRIAQLLPP